MSFRVCDVQTRESRWQCKDVLKWSRPIEAKDNLCVVQVKSFAFVSQLSYQNQAVKAKFDKTMCIVLYEKCNAGKPRR